MRSRLLVIALFTLLGLVLQATFFAEINLFGLGLIPDLVLILVVSYAMLRGPWYGAILGLTAGLIADLFAGGPVGVGALAKTVVGFSAGLLEKAIFKDNLLVPFLALLAGTIINEAVFLAVAGTLGWHFGTVLYFLPKLLLMAAYNAILAPLIYHELYRFENKRQALENTI